MAIVTGAGSGIGRATCVRLAAEGFRIALVGRDESKLREAIKFVSGGGEGLQRAEALLPIATTVADERGVELVVDRVMQQWGRIDALVNNAAIVRVGPIEQSDRAVWEEVFATNVYGPARLIARCWPILQKQGGGRIVNISSMSTIDPFPGLSAYAASKAALESVTRSIMNESDGTIRAFSIVFGAVETTMLRQVATEAQLPREATLDPMEAAALIADCVCGRRDADAGKRIILMKERGVIVQ